MRRIAPLLTVMFLASTAHADIAPDPDSADAHCTLAEQCPDGVECPAGARQDASVVQACMDAAKGKSLAYRCHRDGNYYGTSVYCRPDARGSWSPPQAGGGTTAPSSQPASTASTPGSGSPPRAGGCRCTTSPARGEAGFAAIAGVLALLLGRRMARRTARVASRGLHANARGVAREYGRAGGH
jgi:hypothetical protein